MLNGLLSATPVLYIASAMKALLYILTILIIFIAESFQPSNENNVRAVDFHGRDPENSSCL